MIKVIKISIRLLIIFLSFILTGSCSSDTSETQVRSVKVTNPSPRQGGISKSYPALIKESNETGLGFKTAGQISRVYVKEGDYVKQGQLLATLDAADYQLAVNALQAQYDQMRNEFSRITKLYQNRGVSENEYEKAKAGLEQLGNQLQANKNKLSYTHLYAPANGYIQSVNFSRAEMVDAGTQVFSILDDNGMQVEFDLPVSESETVNSSAVYKLVYNGNESSIPLEFISKSPKADGNQLYTVKLGIDSRKSAALTPGMNGTVTITSSTEDNHSTEGYNIPLRAIIDNGGVSSVWIVNPDTTVTQRQVTFSGIDKQGMAIVTSGITPEDRIVTAGVNSLQEGEKVTVIEPSSQTNVGGLM